MEDSCALGVAMVTELSSCAEVVASTERSWSAFEKDEGLASALEIWVVVWRTSCEEIPKSTDES